MPELSRVADPVTNGREPGRLMSHPMRSRDMTRLLVALIAGTALIAGCGSDDDGSDGAAVSGETASEAGDMAATTAPAKGRPRAGRGVDRDLLGTIERRDGRRQVTYKGQALYFYVEDPRGQVLCNDVLEFGGTWYAVDSRGNPPA